MRLSSLFLAFLVSIGLASCKDYPYEKYGEPLLTYYSCNYLIYNSATFCSEEEEDTCYCSNPAAFSTIARCIATDNRNTTETLNKFIKMCAEYNVSITVDDFNEAYVNYTLYARDTSLIPNYNHSEIIDFPVLLNDSSIDLYYRAYIVFLGNYDNSLYFGAGVLGYWLLVMLIAAIANWTVILFPSSVKPFTGPISNAWRKYITAPALVRRKKTGEQGFLKVFDLIVPSRFESLVIFGFVAVVIGVCACKIYVVENDPVFPDPHQALLRYTADRTGIVVSVFIPLLILFAGRNNFLQWLTRWNFATFITYHRWVGRVAFALVFVHAVCFSATFEGYYAEELAENYVTWGVIATVAGGLIMFQGMLFLRRQWYEVFILVHIVLAAIFIGGAWIHVATLGYVWFYYAASAVWIFDRVVRIARLIAFGAPKAEVILLADETLKVVVPKPSYWKSSPGGHAFIHFLRPSCFWQSHPFTFTETTESQGKIVLYLKVKGGVTHGLYQYLSTHPGKTAQIRVALEGPYGESSAAKGYDSAVFVAGGNGIPGIYSEIYDLALRSPDNTTQSLKLFWVVREYRSLYWFYEELLALKNVRIQTTVFITRPDSHAYIEDFNNRIPLVVDDNVSAIEENGESKEKSSDSKSLSLKEKSNSIGEDEYEDESDMIAKIKLTIKKELAHVTFKEGRPSMEKLVHQEASESIGSTAFVTCGHPVMVDDLRASVIANLGKVEGKRIDFYEQLQVWA